MGRRGKNPRDANDDARSSYKQDSGDEEEPKRRRKDLQEMALKQLSVLADRCNFCKAVANRGGPIIVVLVKIPSNHGDPVMSCKNCAAFFADTLSYMDVRACVLKFQNDTVFAQWVTGGCENKLKQIKPDIPENVAQTSGLKLTVDIRATVLSQNEFFNRFKKYPRAKNTRYHPTATVPSLT